MSDHLPKDLLSEPLLSQEARDLFRAARADALPPTQKRAESLAALKARIAGAPSVAPPPMPASIFPPRRSRFLTRTLVGIAAVLVTIGSAAAVRHQLKQRQLLQNATMLAPAATTPGPLQQASPTSAAATADPASSADTPDLPLDPSLTLDKPNVDHRSHAPPTAGAAARKDDDTNGDLALLGNARQALASHQAADALRFADEDAKKFPASPFREERAYTRIRALCELGRVADAKSDATRFLKQWPTSMYATGVRRSCADL
jgi:hypothetical protein